MELTARNVAVVTGAAGGIGLALAERFASAGLNVVLAELEQGALQGAEQQVAALSVETLAVPTDVSDVAAVNHLAAAAVERFGAAHVVCNNAGVTSYSGTNAPAWIGHGSRKVLSCGHPRPGPPARSASRSPGPAAPRPPGNQRRTSCAFLPSPFLL